MPKGWGGEREGDREKQKEKKRKQESSEEKRSPSEMGDGRGSGGGGGSNRPAWLRDYDLIGKIGEGTYGLVFLARTKQRKCCIAIKKFKQSKDGDGVSPTAIREIMVTDR